MLPAHTRSSQYAVAGLVLASLIWGSSFILVKWAVATIDVYYFLCLRFAIATALLALIFHRRLRATTRATAAAAFLLSVLLSAGFIAQTEGLRFTTASNSGLITGLYLVFIPLGTALWRRATPSVASLAGTALSLAGLFLLTHYSFTGFNRGDGLTLVCSGAYAFHIVYTGRYARRHALIPLVVLQFLFTAIITGVLALVAGGITRAIAPIAWGAILLTSVGATAIAFTLQTAAQKYVDPVRTAIIFSMESVFAMFFAWVLGGEMLSTRALAGAGLMVAGMIVSEVHHARSALAMKAVG